MTEDDQVRRVMSRTGPAEDSWVSWEFHHGLDLLDVMPRPSTRALLRVAFTAGWDAAGGDVRLEALDCLNKMVGNCCGDNVGNALCASWSCPSLQRLVKLLGGEPEYGE